eukprot:RCo046114
MAFATLPSDDSQEWSNLESVITRRQLHSEKALAVALSRVRRVASPRKTVPLIGLQAAIARLEEAAGAPFEFYSQVLPFIQAQALLLPDFFPPGSLRLLSESFAAVTIPRAAVVALLATSFLCPYADIATRSNLPLPCWESAMTSPYTLLLPCLLHYFARAMQAPPYGELRISRKVLPQAPDWRKSSRPLSSLTVCRQGTVESDASALHANFANRYFGGCAQLHGRCVVEETRFAVNTECLVSMVVAPALKVNEAVDILGTERFSSFAYTGYRQSFQWSGSFTDMHKDSKGQPLTRVVAFDAADPGQPQWTTAVKLRELNKAYLAFSASPGERAPLAPVATGNWGYGAFGDKQLMSIIQ